MLIEDNHMVSNKSYDEVEIITALLHDVHNVHGLVFNTRALRLTISKLDRRTTAEGLGFLTKTLPRLGKAFDKAIAGHTPLNSVDYGFDSMENSKLPRFLGEFFSRVLQPNGELLQHPCSDCVQVIRDICYCFYKYELPYSDETEQQVISAFKKTESDLSSIHQLFKELELSVETAYPIRSDRFKAVTQIEIARKARRLLSDLFAFFDPKDIYPKHGPGVVATKQSLWGKYSWSNVSAKITSVYPFDEYFCSSLGHVCDTYDSFKTIKDEDLPAKVILVPKDSRGPRLISCEPVDYQWVQQGLGRAIVELVEHHKLTKFNVFFTDQSPNQRGALLGSSTGRYATLDLKEASDRVSVDLVRLLFPENVYTYLMACRSSSTVLPSGEVLKLNKFAPMGSCLCFPILALTVWAILTAGAPDADTRDGILVYGDDVIVPTAHAANAMEHLESFGLKINRDKSCLAGLFRESCGTDAFNGVKVTPVRFRTVLTSTPSPESYTSWIAYANQLFDRRYFLAYDYIVSRLLHTYGAIPDESMSLTCPSLRFVPDDAKPKRRRWNKNLQRLEFYVTDIKSPTITKDIDGWSMLLRYFTEFGKGRPMQHPVGIRHEGPLWDFNPIIPSSVSSYTSRRTSMLVRRWR
jgi:hypothetical protein